MTARSDRLGIAPLLAVALVGCAFDPIDVDGRPCPCPEGYVCEMPAQVCRAGAARDAGGRDAGRGMDGGGGMDAGGGTDAGPPDCPADAFCEDFEGTNPSGNGWREYPDRSRVAYLGTGNADPNVTAHRGAGMLRVTTVTPGGAAEIEICPFTGFTCPPIDEMFDAGAPRDGGVADLPGITGGDIYIRAHLYVPTDLPDGRPLVMGHASVFHLGVHRGTYFEERALGFNLDVDRVAMYVGTDSSVLRIDPRPPAGDPDPRPMFPRDEWVCIRTHVAVDATNGSVATYVGDSATPAVRRVGIDTLSLLPWRHFGIGLGYTDNMVNGAVLYVDDVAIGRSPIACAE